MCIEDMYKYTCGCTCVHRHPCHAQRSHLTGHCFRVHCPPEPIVKDGICPPCQIVLDCQKKLRAIEGGNFNGTAMAKEREWFSGRTWIEAYDGPPEDATEEVERVDSASGDTEMDILVKKKSWTDGVAWNARQSLETLRRNLQGWIEEKSEKAKVERWQKGQERAMVEGTRARGSGESSVKSWVSGMTRISIGSAARARSAARAGPDGVEKVGGEVTAGRADNAAVGVQKVKVKISWWRKSRMWLAERNRGCIWG